ncbi:hypothetical protein CDL12_29553 [Handroanthus impetiginosus]|uniref:Uncharacterized protein n=1 Tax=Handroanthus impetiginosus TaxID=429701 RepID=A0A2G9FY35_9LAMI|nr:hypothetical protein CDL12_29553 [Handroanthus impetiginosus]
MKISKRELLWNKNCTAKKLTTNSKQWGGKNTGKIIKTWPQSYPEKFSLQHQVVGSSPRGRARVGVGGTTKLVVISKLCSTKGGIRKVIKYKAKVAVMQLCCCTWKHILLPDSEGKTH